MTGRSREPVTPHTSAADAREPRTAFEVEYVGGERWLVRPVTVHPPVPGLGDRVPGLSRGSTTVTGSASPVQQMCARYQRVLGLAATVDPHTQRITVDTRSGLLAAVVMPAPLGEAVSAGIRTPYGPVIAHPWSRRWTFLTTTTTTGYGSGEIAGWLLNLNVFLAAGPVVLPSPSDARWEFRRWVREPAHDRRPALSQVIDLVRSLR